VTLPWPRRKGDELAAATMKIMNVRYGKQSPAGTEC
jgi:hypothetical protein